MRKPGLALLLVVAGCAAPRAEMPPLARAASTSVTMETDVCAATADAARIFHDDPRVVGATAAPTAPAGVMVVVSCRLMRLSGQELQGAFGLSPWTPAADVHGDSAPVRAAVDSLAARAKDRVVTAPRITMYPSQRAGVNVVQQTSAVSGWRGTSSAGAPTLEPVSSVISAGMSLELLPVLEDDGRTIVLDLDWAVGRLADARSTASVGVPSGDRVRRVDIELPVVVRQRVRTRVSVPDGGTVLLAGPGSPETDEADVITIEVRVLHDADVEFADGVEIDLDPR